MGAAERRKGPTWEREMAKRYRAAFPGVDSKRVRQESINDKGAEDVTHPWFHTECKAWRKCNFRSALKQAVEGAPEDKWPVAICKDDPERPFAPEQSFVIMRLEDWLEMTAAHWKETKG